MTTTGIARVLWAGVTVCVLAAGLAFAAASSAAAQPITNAVDCAASFRFAEEPVPVVKTADGETVLASVEWGYSAAHNLCYLALDDRAIAVLRANEAKIVGTTPPQDAAAAARCRRAYNPERGFAAEPVPVVKTADGQTVLATVRWGYSADHNLCYLVLDDQAIAVLRMAMNAAQHERYEQRLAAAVETLDDDALCPQADAPESFDGVAEVGRIQGGCVVLEYVALGGRTMAELRDEFSGDATVFAVGSPVVDVAPLQAPSGLYDDPSLPQWHLDALEAGKLWDPNGWEYTDDQGNKRTAPGWPAGAEITVAVIDSGVDIYHQDLEENLLTTGHPCNTEDSLDHGTMVAGIIAAEQGNTTDVAGIAPQARILPVRVLDPDYSCEKLFPTLTRAIDYARTSGADVINMSLGKSREDVQEEEQDGDFRNDHALHCIANEGGVGLLARVSYCLSRDTMKWALQVARNQGVVTVAAAGNCGNDHPYSKIVTSRYDDGEARYWEYERRDDKSDTSGEYGSDWVHAWEMDPGCDRHNQFSYPASYPETITVAATDENGERVYDSTSNIFVDFAAPGERIRSTLREGGRTRTGTSTASGTSAAAPMVSAAVAHIKARFPHLNPGQIYNALKLTASNYPNFTNDLGWGIIDPVAAIEHLDQQLNSPTISTEESDGLEEPDKTGSTFTSLSLGYGHTCGIRDDGTVSCWGDNRASRYRYQDDARNALANVPDGQFTALSSGDLHACGIRTDRTVACWGDNGYRETDVPDGQFTALSARGVNTCGIRSDRTIACWGGANYRWSDRAVPDGQFTAVSVSGSYACGIKTDGTVACWDTSGYRWAEHVPGGQFTSLSSSGDQTCGIRADRTVACWGEGNRSSFVELIDPPKGAFTALSVGFDHVCGIKTDRTVACSYASSGSRPWINSYSPVPQGQFTALSSGSNHACGIRADGTVACWGNNSGGRADVPEGQFTSISTGAQHACGIRTNGTVACWGSNIHGQTDVPS